MMLWWHQPPIDIGGSEEVISMLGRKANFDQEKGEGFLRIDLGNMYLNELPGLYAWTVKLEGVKL